MKSKYSVVRTFRNGVAPALTWDKKWIFVDKDLNRINEYQYSGMDPVLRNGIYDVYNGDHQYGAAYFDGKPIINEWYDYPLQFFHGLTECCRLHLDEKGKEIRLPGGQPQYDRGILKSDGTYLFPMVYIDLNWNDYKKKNCWFAEDSDFCYLLFPDGRKRVYRKSSKVRNGMLDCIPMTEYDKNIPEKETKDTSLPKVVLSENYAVFDSKLFISKLKCWIEDWFHPLHFYYRDTDADCHFLI